MILNERISKPSLTLLHGSLKPANYTITQSNGKNDLNIQSRVERGAGVKKQVIQMLDELTLSDYYFEGAIIIILRANFFYLCKIMNLRHLERCE